MDDDWQQWGYQLALNWFAKTEQPGSADPRHGAWKDLFDQTGGGGGGGGEWADVHFLLIGAAMCLLGLVILWYTLRGAAKVIDWMVQMALRVGVAMLVFGIVIGLFLFLTPILTQTFPWMTNQPSVKSTGFQTATAPTPTTPLDGWGLAETRELEIDALTGATIRLPRLGDTVHDETAHSWREYLQDMVGEEVASVVLDRNLGAASRGANGLWWTWIGVKYITRLASQSAYGLVSSAVMGTVGVAGNLFQSLYIEQYTSPSPSSSSSSSSSSQQQQRQQAEADTNAAMGMTP